MRDAGLKEPMFEMDDFFRVTFYRDPRYSLKADSFEKVRATMEKTRGKGWVEKGVERSEKKVGEKVGVKVGEKLTTNRQKIINHMLQNKTISAKELSELVGISQRKIEENISWLKEKGLINRIGPDKGGHWEIVDV
jgi:ATP-dependent DNA helicase RecG